MAFLRSYAYLDAEPVLQCGRVMLRAPAMADYADWAQLRSTSRAFLEPWEPTWPRDDLTRSAFRQRVRRYNRDMRDDYAYAFFIFSRSGGELVGGLTLSNVRRGVAQAASVGYWIGLPFARNGYMTDALTGAVSFAFDSLRLHRVEAACLPENQASRRLLLRVGFSEEGYARQYLKINGRWQDHLLFALLDNDPPGRFSRAGHGNTGG
ncbi:MAG: GNAT family protein [Anderseniella sp.]|jgi:ribosomal-protein-alanine N-acetyltransferase|nr:GNAT family protein [Anderseniella sp.]